MEFRQVRHFLSVFNEGSFSRAASTLGLTQQTLSKSIANLENELGVRLFDRDTRNCDLTSHGELLLQYAKNIDAEERQFQRHLDDFIGVRSGHLRIGAGLTPGVHIIPEAVVRLKEKRKNLKITVIEGMAINLMPRLLRGELDIIVGVIANPIKDPLVHTEFLYDESLCLLASAQHPLAAKKKVALKETLDFPWLVGWTPGGLDQAVSDSFAEQGLSPPVAKIETDSFTFIRSMLGTTEYLAILPERLFEKEVKSGSLKAIPLTAKLQRWKRPMAICYRRNSTRSPAAMACIHEIERVTKVLM
ncbi:MAG: LysR family transcriptional regulator [Rhodospirillaceae bacterium]